MIFRIAAKEETSLTHVKIETFQATVSETHNRILLANITLGLKIEIRNYCQNIQNKIDLLEKSSVVLYSPDV